jgi:hypothetical protein
VTGAARVAAAVLAAVFTWSALAKLVRRDATADAFAALGLHRPRDLAVVVPALELLVALELVVVPLVGAYGALFLLIAFTVVLLGVVRRGVLVECACFGSVSSRPAEPVSWRSLVRNSALVALAVFVALGAPSHLSGR